MDSGSIGRATGPVCYTIGHSNRTIEEFLDMLQGPIIKLIVDVRTIPRSRHNTQYDKDSLTQTLSTASIGYVHLAALGGLRHAKADSANQGWINASFRGFADYMQTQEFENGLQTLIDFAQGQSTAIMCAEAVPWRCHRSLIGDALLARGFTVLDIMSRTVIRPHAMTPWADVQGTKVIYPGKRDRLT